MDLDATIYLKDVLHLVSQALLIPVMIVLVALVAYAVFSVGSLIVELLTERRRFKVSIPEFIDAINDATATDLTGVIGQSGLLKDQKLILITVAQSMGLPKEDLFALAKAELSAEKEMYDKITGRNDLVTRIGPIFGLLATLIPLGPGIVALGQGEVNMLSESLLIAFDGTVAGLVSAAVFMLIARFRKRWYARYMLALETGMRCILQKAEQVTPEALEAAGIGGGVHNASARMKRAETRAVGGKLSPSADGPAPARGADRLGSDTDDADKPGTAPNASDADKPSPGARGTGKG
jgi:biopolymer transport protein ExbB/TolQ